MNTEQLLFQIEEAKWKYESRCGILPKKLYLDSVHAMKLEWYIKEHCIYKNASPVVKDGVYYNGMRVFPVMVADEHLQIC